MARLPVPAVVAVLLLAGCSGAVTEPSPATPSLTPVAVPADRTPWPISHAGVPDAAALVAAHERTLRNRTVAVSVYERAYEDGVTDHDYDAVTDGRNVSARLVVERFERLDGGRVNESVTVTEQYTASGRTLSRVTWPDGSVSYDQRVGEAARPVDPTRAAQLHALFAAGDVNVANSLSYGGNYRVWAESFGVRRLPTVAGPVTDATVTDLYATVTPRGRVVGYRFDYAGVRNGSDARGWVTVAFESSGPVAPPDWHDEALAATGGNAEGVTVRTPRHDRVEPSRARGRCGASAVGGWL
ncbi:hypothetical protein [Halorarius halobius]|uniref:hypothetical protein n=1 Tax=Halorarius halobius TaxID=2962671 RepID=UPI0020CD66CF|nr:hypothetical protein [Halorarius halobius]